MRKLAVFTVFILLVTLTAFGQENEIFDVRTSNGLYWVIYFYDGQNRGQKRADWMVADPNIGGGERTWTPEKSHWECLNYIISLLRPKRGDTYVITIRRPSRATNIYDYFDEVKYTFVIEFTSPTQYFYWFSRG